MTDQSANQPGKDRHESAGEASPESDVTAPTTDAELDQALEDTFPASDPINFAGSTAGRSPENAENPPVGTHPLAGAEGGEKDIDDAHPDPGVARERSKGP